MHDLLVTLVHLDPTALHARAGKAVRRQADAAWELAACLVAVERSGSFRAFDCTSAVDYAERRLGLGPCKALELLRGGRALERHPKLSEACRDGRLCWSKLREIARAVQPETEEQWLAFALAHTTREVERAVAVSPAQFRREQADGAAERGAEPSSHPCMVFGVAELTTPASTFDATARTATMTLPDAAGGSSTATVLEATVEELAPAPRAAAMPGAPQAPTGAGLAAPETGTAPTATPFAPPPPRLVRLEMYLTPDQFAIWDTALNRVRSEKSRHVSKENALEALARHYLTGGDSRTRTNHPVVLRADPMTGSTWYETSRGILPASAEATEDALARERGTFVELPNPEPAEEPSRTTGTAPATEPANASPAAPATEEQPVVPTPASPGAATVPSHHADHSPSAGVARKPVPAARRHAALARAHYRCQRCGATTRLEVDHVTAVCDGGADRDLQVLCHACHALKHAEDFAADPRYIGGKAAGIARQERRIVDAVAREADPGTALRTGVPALPSG